MAVAVAAQRDLFERDLVAALDEEMQRVATMSRYELDESARQLLNLGQGSDCHYDRPSIGLSYAVWYLPRRIHDGVIALLPYSGTDDDLAILDLGAGNGATWMAALLIERARAALGRPQRSVRITAVDSSAPMLHCGRRVWSHLTRDNTFGVDVASSVETWSGNHSVGDEPIIVASYLFDHSDRARSGELGDLLVNVAESVRSREVVLISAINKVRTTGEVLRGIDRSTAHWKCSTDQLRPMWSGEARGVGSVRERMVTLLSDEVRSRLSRGAPAWSDRTSVLHRLRRASYDTLDVRAPRGSWILDGPQEAAATPSDRLTVIVGAAGSGKSRVLVERLVRRLELLHTRRVPETRVLVTAFNKEVVDQLYWWTADALNSRDEFRNRFRSSGGGSGQWTVQLAPFGQGVSTTTMRFLNWDRVPIRLFGAPFQPVSPQSEEVLSRIIETWCARDGSGERRRWLAARTWVTPEFVQAEITRVVYGLGALDEESYLQVERRGRGDAGRGLPFGGQDRKMLWSLMQGEPRIQLYVDNRIEALRRLRSGEQPIQFDYLFFDECQDLLPVEFDELLPSLVPDPNRITVVGDAAQALHTGSSYARPKSVGSVASSVRRRWDEHSLSGSYRLPIRVCEALAPLAEELLRTQRAGRSEGERRSTEEPEVAPEDIVSPVSMKNAVVGIRPIVVVARNMTDLADQLAAILGIHGELVSADVARLHVTYAEGHHARDQLRQELGRHATFKGVAVHGESMLKIKGLERPVVVWDSKNIGGATTGTSLLEWIYTVLTRTTGLLIVHLSSLTEPSARAFLGRMRKDRLLFWSEEAEHRFDEWSSLSRDLPL